jgi:signal transduction histidine kinase/ActR/RegA family two-component response regulator
VQRQTSPLPKSPGGITDVLTTKTQVAFSCLLMRLKAFVSSKLLNAWWWGIAASVFIWGFIAWDLDRLHDQSVHDAQRRLENWVSLYAEEVSSSINSIDYLLIDFRDEWDGDAKSFQELIEKRRNYVDPDMGYNVGILDQQGQLIFSTVAVASLPIDLSDREHFQNHFRDPDDALYVGKPMEMRVKAQWGIPFSRPLSNKDGSFNGLIGVTVLPDYFSRFHKRVDLGEDGSIFLGRTDGYALARHPRPELALGDVIKDAPWLGASPNGKGFFQGHSKVDQVVRLYAWQTLERGNLAVVMGKSMATVLAPYHHQRTVYLIGGKAASLFLLLAAYLWIRHQRHRAQAYAEMQKMEATLAHSQRMESIGKLTGGVTHDFNHILQIITSNLQVIEINGPGSNQIEPHLKSIATATERGTKLAAQLLTFARRQPLHPTVVDMGRLLGRIDHLLQQLAGPGINVQISIPEQVWSVRVDAGLLENVIMNLAANARDAMEGVGILCIRVDNERLGQHQTGNYPDLAPGEYVLLAMTDNGCGMLPEVTEHAFEPFFTTKPEGKGTGLGLSMAYGFIKESNGHIHIDSAPDKGTTIRIFLPRSLEEASRMSAAPVLALTGGVETILFVDDSAELRMMMGMMLEHSGYHVVRAPNAQEALAILEQGEAIDVLFTDIRMPGRMNGIELAKQAKAMRPDLMILLASGNDDLGDSPSDLAEVHDFPFLAKPYTVQEADAMLRRFLSPKEIKAVSA